jgi:hypothetical protein
MTNSTKIVVPQQTEVANGTAGDGSSLDYFPVATGFNELHPSRRVDRSVAKEIVL